MHSSRKAIAEFRARRREHQFYRYEALTSADRWHAGRRLLAKAILAGNWQWKGRRSVSLSPPVDWNGLCSENRSQHLALHSWEPLAPLIAAYDHTGDRACFDLALTLMLDWLEKFPSIDDTPSPFSWYDLAVGARAHRLAYMLDVVARDSEKGDELVSPLFAGLRLHAAALVDDERFARHSNHGFYQVLGQMAMARRFPDIVEIAAAGRQARDRLDELLRSHFTAEGIHREHSPHYHDLVLIPLRALQEAELVRDPRIGALCERIEEALSWFVTPAARYAMFGDTSRQTVTNRNPKQFATASLRFALSAGHMGTPPVVPTRGFPESGYVVFRDRWPSGASDFSDCSYLAQTCAFHSRVHKHADDLSFVWYDRGCDILTDAGRFGYVGKTEPDSELFAQGFWYSDPRRIYVESTHAHNTVEVDGRSTPRRGVEPYGSALTQWGERGEIRFSESRFCSNELAHTRVLLFLPRSWLLVVDHLADSGHEHHDFAQRFHLAPELDLIREEGQEMKSIAAELPSGDHLYAAALLPQAPIAPVRGAKDPQLMGWISSRDGVMEPQWTFGWSASAVTAYTFASLFCFADRPLSVDLEKNQMSTDATCARLSWKANGRRSIVEFERILGHSIDIDYSIEEQPDDDRY